MKNKNEQQRTATSSLKKAKMYDKSILNVVARFTKSDKTYNYHPQYHKNNKKQPYCHLIIQHKIEKLKQLFKDKIKKK